VAGAWAGCVASPGWGAPPPLLRATAGAVVSRVNPSLLLVPVLPAGSLAWGVILCPPSPASVTDVFHTPPVAVVVPIFDPLSNRGGPRFALQSATPPAPRLVFASR